MRAKEKTILEFIGGLEKVFIIPPFQRNYEWSLDQCNELFDDIVNANRNNKTHYLGNIVSYLGRNTDASFTEVILVDGQQRVTTILLLLCAIRDAMTEDKKINTLNSKYLLNDSDNEQFRVRLKQTSYDQNSFAKILQSDLTDLEASSNVVKNYFHFKKLINNIDIDINDIYNTISKLEVVDVMLEIGGNLEEVQTVFEKINSTGKRLSSGDLIRNYLLIASNSNEQEKLYQNYWVKIEKLIKNENISRFARDYLVLNTFEDVSEAKVYSNFKDNFNNNNAKKEDVLADMLIYAKYYNWIKFEVIPNTKLNKKIEMLNYMKCDDLYPLLVYLFKNSYENNVKELSDILTILSDFWLRYRIVSPSSGGGTLRTVINQLLEKLNSSEIELSKKDILFELSNSNTPAGRYPNDIEFKEALRFPISLNYAKVLLIKIEESERSNISVPFKEITMEHFMPQTLSSWWIDYLGGNEVANQIHSNYLNCIGNLGPISQSYNSKNSNKNWEHKIKNIEEVQFFVTSEVSQFNDWKESDIKVRNENISQRAVDSITSPLERTRPYNSQNTFENIEDGIYKLADLQHYMPGITLECIVYKGQNYKVKTWKKMLSLACSIALKENATLFNKLIDENTIHKSTSSKNHPHKDPIITANKNLLVEAIQVEDNDIYSEGVLSGQRARHYTYQLLKLFNLEDDFQLNLK